MKKLLIFLGIWLSVTLSAAYAGEADVLKVEAKKLGKNTYRFSVTVFHKDTGEDHYADKWDIIGEDDTVFGTRVLGHPHVDEQPFTRSLSDVVIPDRYESVIIRAHDSVHAYGGKVIKLKLPE